MAYTVTQKRQLSDLFAKEYTKQGKKVKLPRQPYRDDDEGGEGSAGLNVETHPLLANLPVGADSDLTAIAAANSKITEAALERNEQELSPELKKQPVLQQRLGQEYRSTPKLSPPPL